MAKKAAVIIDPTEQIKELQAQYTFLKPEPIFDFIGKYPFLLTTLQEAPSRIHQFFPNARLTLEVFPIYEEGDTEHLTITIATSLDYLEVGSKLDELAEVWWIDAFAEADLKLNITVDFL